ncbi:MAG: glutamate-5-semialdehyde dehydrogenase [Rhodothermales bacterium]|nr:glutamate-5-semialdehyde dehydrogenase [Rhodothermales bacterium]
MEVTTDLIHTGTLARDASHVLTVLSTAQKDAALLAIADALEARTARVLAANAIDIEAGRAKGLSAALLDRLLLNEARIAALAADTRKVAGLPDPVGSDIESRLLPNGLRVTKRRIPLGVIGVIYEARPNVTIDIATLCLKTGNAAILRGGTETIHSNSALAQVIQEALAGTAVPATAVQYIDNPDRELVGQLLRLDQFVDVIIPRGGASLHRRCKEQSTIPVITGGVGICHVFVDESADLQQAVDIVENGKTHRPSVCNSLDTVLVYRPVAEAFLPKMAERLKRHGVELRATADALAMLQQAGHEARLAGPEDFDTEWMSLVLGVKIVDSMDEAIAHIRRHSMDHSDAIVTRDFANANRFVNAVNSSAVFVNASTRFNDGGQFGLGAEVAVSTQKLHARGPMGLAELTTYKWIGVGDGHVRK